MARVKTDEISNLLATVIQKFQKETGILLRDVNKAIFFEELTKQLQKKVQQKLKPGTVYKSFYLRLNNSAEAELGFAWHYLNALSQYMYDVDYREKFSVEKSTSHQESIEENIQKGLYDDPETAEYPPENPSFPATPIFPISIDGHRNVIIKDESTNMTGTHKDRMAWEIFLYARQEIPKRWAKGEVGTRLNFSLMSSGSAAIAIYERLKIHDVPFKLNVLFDDRIVNENVQRALNHIQRQDSERFRLWPANLEVNVLNSQGVLNFTDNKNGIDLTFDSGLDDIKRDYYDWLSYEILNQSPNYCFVPFGSGDLFFGLLNTLKKEIETENISKRYFGKTDILKECHFLGATTLDKSSRLDKLYSPKEFHPMFRDENETQYYIEARTCGNYTDIHEVKIEYLHQAESLAVEQGITHEPSGIAGLALFLQMKDDLGITDQKVLIVNTGKLKLDKYLK